MLKPTPGVRVDAPAGIGEEAEWPFTLDSAAGNGRGSSRREPADLRVMRASKLELVVNRRTARAFALAILPAFLLRADPVIE